MGSNNINVPVVATLAAATAGLLVGAAVNQQPTRITYIGGGQPTVPQYAGLTSYQTQQQSGDSFFSIVRDAIKVTVALVFAGAITKGFHNIVNHGRNTYNKIRDIRIDKIHELISPERLTTKIDSILKDIQLEFEKGKFGQEDTPYPTVAELLSNPSKYGPRLAGKVWDLFDEVGANLRETFGIERPSNVEQSLENSHNNVSDGPQHPLSIKADAILTTMKSVNLKSSLASKADFAIALHSQLLELAKDHPGIVSTQSYVELMEIYGKVEKMDRPDLKAKFSRYFSINDSFRDFNSSVTGLVTELTLLSEQKVV